MHYMGQLQLILLASAISATTVIDNIFNSSTEVIPTLLSKTVKIQAKYSTLYKYYVNASTEYVFYYKSSDIGIFDGARIHVQSDDATIEYPIIVTVRQKKGILAWQVPTQVQSRYSRNSFHYLNTSRNLCPSNYYEDRDYQLSGHSEHVAINIATASRYNTSFYLVLNPVRNFYINPGESRTVHISPSEPFYFGYDFTKSNDNRSVLVKVSSESQVCMTFFIQNTTCPVLGYDGNTRLAGNWQTVSLQGSITVTKTAYPHGFFIVFLVNPDDYQCSENSTTIPDRRKTFRLTIEYEIEQNKYIWALVTVASVFVGFCVVYIVVILFCKLHRPETTSRQIPVNTLDGYLDDTDHGINLQHDTVSIADDVDFSPAIINPTAIDAAACITDVENQRRNIYLIDLSRQELTVISNKSLLYFKYIMTIAIFYIDPVAQSVIADQWKVHETGNEDFCYYNFQCSHPMLFLSDFNHVFSNLGYIILGPLFMFIAYIKEKHNNLYLDEMGCGIPQHYGLYYAMGFAMMMEGLLSACYHVCPNRKNFQFDTSFMYITSVLYMIKIYQNRHPDVHAGAPVTFGVLAHTILIALTGILANTSYVWIILTIAHLIFCLFVSYRIYYINPINVDLTLLPHKFKTKMHDIYMILKLKSRPRFAKRLIILLFSNICNIGFAIYAIIYLSQDFGTYLLMTLILNLILYKSFYIIMKCWHRERICFQSVIYIFLTIVTWICAVNFYKEDITSWTTTAAESRNQNQPCLSWFFDFYDSHDVWHFLSAIAMFFSFMTLLTLDDDIVNVPRSQIHVF